VSEAPSESEAARQTAAAGRGLIAAALAALRTRLDLAAVELEIYLLVFARMLAWLFGAVACVLLALAFAVTALIAALWDTHRMLGLLGGSAAFVLLAALLGYLGMRTLRGRGSVLSGTLAQLSEDQRRTGGTP